MNSGHRRMWRACVAIALLAGVVVNVQAVQAGGPRTTSVQYKSTTVADYQQKWSNIYGPGELAAGGTLSVGSNGAITVDAHQFHTAFDYSVYDHLKYIAVSSSSFAVPGTGSLEFSVNIKASTPGTQQGRVIHGCYGAPGSYAAVGDPCEKPWEQIARQGQQAGVVLNMINFQTGQLFDWFISEDRAFALIERLPSNVTGSGDVGLDRAYTQIIKEAPIEPGQAHNVVIRYTRGPGTSYVEYLLDGNRFARVDHVGIPLDKQGVPFTGYAPSLGAGEELTLGSFVIGHGLFSLLDAFPYQHPDAPELSVSIPSSERIFGQGAIGTFSNVTVTTRNG
jgi:hypothetical protein